MLRPSLVSLLLAVGLLAGVATGCGSSSTPSASTADNPSGNTTGPTTSIESTASTEPPSPTTTSEEATTSSAPAAPDAISVAVYWTRPSGTAQPLDITGYKDPTDGPYPYVLYGSVTNAGARPYPAPHVIVDWQADGASVYQKSVAVLDPQGVPLDHLDPGASGDLLVVVDRDEVADQLADAQPTFGLAQP